jgi:hypothetical protein
MRFLFWDYQFKTLRGSNFQMNFLKKYFQNFAPEKQTLFFLTNHFDFKNLGSKKYGKLSPLRKPY